MTCEPKKDCYHAREFPRGVNPPPCGGGTVPLGTFSGVPAIRGCRPSPFSRERKETRGLVAAFHRPLLLAVKVEMKETSI